MVIVNVSPLYSVGQNRDGYLAEYVLLLFKERIFFKQWYFYLYLETMSILPCGLRRMKCYI